MRPVVLVHGFASSFQREWVDPGWTLLLEEAGREIVGVDMLGHGEAPKPHDPAAYADLGGRIRDAIGDGPVDAIGFSLGARTLLEIAAAAPEKFGRLVVGGVGDATFSRGDPALGEAMARAIEGEEAEHPMMRAFARFAAGNNNDPKALSACLRRPGGGDVDLRAITVPVLVVAGDRDTLAGSPTALADQLPDGRAVVLKKVDHFGAANDFGFIDATLAFLT